MKISINKILILITFTFFISFACSVVKKRELTVVLPSIICHFVNSSDMIPIKNAIGAATINEVWVLSEFKDGKIYPKQVVLGHEVCHLLHWFHPEQFTNPDD